MPRRVMGHAGAWAAPGEASAEMKWKALENAGVTMVDHPAKFGNVMKTILAQSGRDVKSVRRTVAITRTCKLTTFQQLSAANQRRGYYTRRPGLQHVQIRSGALAHLRRSLHLRPDQAAQLLSDHGILASSSPASPKDSRLLCVTIDRTARSPCIIASPTTEPSQIYRRSRHIPFDYRTGPTDQHVTQVLELLQMDAAPPTAKAATTKLIKQLWEIFRKKEAVSLEMHISVPASVDSLTITNLDFTFDDAAFRSSKRQADLHALRDTSLEDPVELSAEPDGIVYIKLDGEERTIGTLVNGAGLAMNTVDALATHGGYAANFLDTGGKATSETVKRSFELLLQDKRVKAIFVNIFGGLTLGDMIARGVLLAFKELDMPVPIVVRIRGTNEKEGQKIIAESGLKLFAYDDFEQAAEKVVELANGK